MKGKKVSKRTGSVIIVRLVTASHFTESLIFDLILCSHELGFQQHRSSYYAMLKSYSVIAIKG